MKKRVLSAIMAIVFVVAVSVPAFATEYSDLTNHWAKTYMEDLAAGGYLTGYSNGKMLPEKNISTCELLTVLSRLYTLTDLEYEMIRSDYETVVKEAVPSTLSWAYKNIEICLAAGIVTNSELKSINLSADIEKEQLAVFLIRAIQLTSAANNLNNAELSFDDAASISSDCVGSVTELVTLGIVKGDNKNYFSPKSSVTRAVAATMVSRSLDYLETNKITLAIAAYDGVMREEGIISDVNASSVDICCFDGLTREYSVSSDAAVTVNQIGKALNSTYKGCYTTVTYKNGVVVSMAVVSDSSVKWVQGAVSSLYTNASNNIIYITNLASFSVLSYNVSNTAKITQDGKTISFASIPNNNFVTIKLVNDVATEVYSAKSDTTLTGTISELKYGSTITFKITDDKATEYCFLFDISNLPTFLRGDTTITIDRLKAGNTVTMNIDDCRVTSVVSKGLENAITCELTSTTTSTSGTVWVITVDGVQTSYVVDDYVSVYNGKTEILLTDIHIGDQVSIVVYDNTITEINLLSTPSASSTKVSGTVLKVDTSNRLITILTSENKLVYVQTTFVVSMIVASTGNSIYLNSVALDSKLTAYGSYSDSKTFTAKSIIIE